MLIDRRHWGWGLSSLAALAAATVVYWLTLYGRPGSVGGTVPGLAFGVIGLGLMIAAALLSARRQARTRRLGSAKAWLKAHIWLGLLSVPMVWFHSGRRLGGPLETALWVLFAIVIVSGLFGLVLQNVLPRLLTARVPLETFVEQMPYLAQRKQFLLDKSVAEICGPLQIPGDPTVKLFQSIVQFKPGNSKTASKLFGELPDKLVLDDQDFFKRMGIHAQAEWEKPWSIQSPGDLRKLLPMIYADLATQPAEPAPSLTDRPREADAPPSQPDKAQELKNHYIKGLRPVVTEERLTVDQSDAAAKARAALFLDKTAWPQTFWPLIDDLRKACEETRQYAFSEISIVGSMAGCGCTFRCPWPSSYWCSCTLSRPFGLYRFESAGIPDERAGMRFWVKAIEWSA